MYAPCWIWVYPVRTTSRGMLEAFCEATSDGHRDIELWDPSRASEVDSIKVLQKHYSYRTLSSNLSLNSSCWKTTMALDVGVPAASISAHAFPPVSVGHQVRIAGGKGHTHPEITVVIST